MPICFSLGEMHNRESNILFSRPEVGVDFLVCSCVIAVSGPAWRIKTPELEHATTPDQEKGVMHMLGAGLSWRPGLTAQRRQALAGPWLLSSPCSYTTPLTTQCRSNGRTTSGLRG